MAFERTWFLEDGFGPGWIVRLSFGSSVPLPSSDDGALAVIRILNRALDPWGHAPAEPNRIFLDMFERVAWGNT